MKRFGSATWSGSLHDGKGAVSTESRAMTNHPYTFFSRYGETPGTNPEELLGAAAFILTDEIGKTSKCKHLQVNGGRHWSIVTPLARAALKSRSCEIQARD